MIFKNYTKETYVSYMTSFSRTIGPISTKIIHFKIIFFKSNFIYCTRIIIICSSLCTATNYFSCERCGPWVSSFENIIFRKVIVILFLSKTTMYIHHRILILALKCNFPIRNYYNYFKTVFKIFDNKNEFCI